MFPDINRVVEITMRLEQEDEKEPQLQFRPNLVDFSDYRVKEKQPNRPTVRQEKQLLLHNIWKPENTGM